MGGLIISDILFCYLPVFLLCFFSIINLFRSITKNNSFVSGTPIRHPPSPPALPVIGHLHLLGSGLSKSFKTLAIRHGPLIRLRMASTTSIIVSNAAVAKEMLKHNEMNFVSRPDFGGSSDYNIYKDYTFVFADYGTYWRFVKKLCVTELLSVSQVNRFADIRREEKIKILETLVKCGKERKACNFGKEMMILTNNIICRMTMSSRCSCSHNESEKVWKFVKEIEALTLKFSLGELLGPLSKLDLFGYGKKLRALLMDFDAFVENIMVQHEIDLKSGKKDKKDTMDILLEICWDEKAEVRLSRMHIKSFLMVSELILLYLFTIICHTQRNLVHDIYIFFKHTITYTHTITCKQVIEI